MKTKATVAGTPTNVLSPKELGWASFTGFIQYNVWQLWTGISSGYKSEDGFCTWWVSARLRTDGWCWWCMMILDGGRLMQVVLPSPMLVDEQLGFWRRLTTQTRQILRFQGGSGGLAIWGKLFPLRSTGDKVSQSWEVFTRTCWRGRSYWLIWLALSRCVGIYIFCYDIVSYCILDDFHNSSCCGKCPSLGDLQAFLRFRVSISDQSYAGIIFSTPFLRQKKLELNL